MTPNPQRVQSIFHDAIEQHAAADWPAFLDRACGSDVALRHAVEALLRGHEQANSLLDDEPAPLPATANEVTTVPGTVIGPYKLLEPIGEGGMGTVWMAQQTEPVKRVVALKLIRAGIVSKQVIARFEAERQALALMDHPNIARVLDAGATSAGRPYFVMDFVKGVPITKYCDEHLLPPRQRLDLFIPVCQAVQHAHQKGIIHRDLKPSNVLVALYDGKPVPKVIDFGVAKAAGQSLTDKTLVTGFGNIVGTLEYMSPEQTEINQLDIDTRSDIYSLGVLLYELLTGSPPFSRKELEKAGMLEMLRVIREQEPSKPSTKLSTAEGLPTLAANRGTEPAKLTNLVRGELDWIVMKALEKDRNRRYETANGFALDVQRYLADEPVRACPPSVSYRFRKFAHRNKTGLVMAALVLFFVVLLGSGIAWTVRHRTAQQANVAGQVELILAEVDRLEGESLWAEALIAVRRAQALVSGGGADAATTRRVRGRLTDLELIDRLELIRLRAATIVEHKLDLSGADPEYVGAFQHYGVDVDQLSVEAAVDRLQARPALALPLAAALDNWAAIRRSTPAGNSSGWQRLVAVARGIDPDPMRDQIRASWERPLAEARDALRRLADVIDVRTHHPATLAILGRTLRSSRHPEPGLRLLRSAQSAYPGDFWLNFELGLALNQQRDHDGAIRYYTVAVALRPKTAVAHHNLGHALRLRKRLEESAICGSKAVELEPTSGRAHSGLGATLHALNKYDEAIAHYRQAAELDPKTAKVAFNNIGVALQAQNKMAEAIAAYRQAIDLDATYALPHANIGNVLRAQKRPAEAIAAYQKAIALDPECAPAYFGLGRVRCDQRKLPEAVVAFRKAIDLDPDHHIYHYHLGTALRQQGKFDEAGTTYRKALERDPTYFNTYMLLGALLCDDLKDYAQAVACFQKATELDPESAPAYTNLGLALSGQKKLDEAIVAYRKAIACDAKHANAHNLLGLALEKQGKRDEAVAAFTEALRLHPNFPSAQANLVNAAWYLVACPDLKARDPKRAVELFKLVLAGNPVPELLAHFAPMLLLADETETYRRLSALAFDRFGHTEEPRTAYLLARICALAPGAVPDPGKLVPIAAKAVRAEPVPHHLHTFGLAHYRAGQFEAAIKHLHKSIEGRWSANAANWLVLAMAHQRLGHADEARKWFDEAVRWFEKVRLEVSTDSVDRRQPLHRHDSLACLVLRREAEALLGLRPGPPSTGKHAPGEKK